MPKLYGIIILNLLEFSQYEYEKSNSLHPRAPLQNDYFSGKNFSDFCFLIYSSIDCQDNFLIFQFAASRIKLDRVYLAYS